MFLLTTKAKKTPEFVEWRQRAQAAALTSLTPGAFTREEFLLMVDVNNVFFCVERVRQKEFIGFLDSIYTRYKQTGSFDLSHDEATTLIDWVDQATELIGELTLARFKQSKKAADNFANKVKTQNASPNYVV